MAGMEVNMELELDFLEKQGININEAIAYTGSLENYISALQRYFKGYEASRKAVLDFLSAGDIENYMIKIHALKSNSKMIGALDLASAFNELELAAKRGDMDYIKNFNDPAIEKYDSVHDIIRPIGEMREIHAPGEIGAGEAREISEKLLETLDDFDSDVSFQLAVKLKGYPFRMTQRDKLNRAIDLIKDFLYDEAAEIIREISAEIE